MIVGHTLTTVLNAGLAVDNSVGDLKVWEIPDAITISASAQLLASHASWDSAVVAVEASIDGLYWYNFTTPLVFTADNDAQNGAVLSGLCLRYVRAVVTTKATTASPEIQVTIHYHEEK